MKVYQRHLKKSSIVFKNRFQEKEVYTPVPFPRGERRNDKKRLQEVRVGLGV